MTPKYQVLPDLPAEEFQALMEDIRCRGVQLPIEVTTEDEVLDGHQRLRACEQLAIRDYPVKVVAGLRTDQEKRHHAIRANLLRRQLTREQRRTLIADELRRARGKLSNRVLAGLFGCSDHTIATVRRELESGAEMAPAQVRPIRNCLGRGRPGQAAVRPVGSSGGDSGSRRTSPTWWLCWSAMMPIVSLDRTSEPTAGLSEQRGGLRSVSVRTTRANQWFPIR